MLEFRNRGSTRGWSETGGWLPSRNGSENCSMGAMPRATAGVAMACLALLQEEDPWGVWRGLEAGAGMRSSGRFRFMGLTAPAKILKESVKKTPVEKLQLADIAPSPTDIHEMS